MAAVSRLPTARMRPVSAAAQDLRVLGPGTPIAGPDMPITGHVPSQMPRNGGGASAPPPLVVVASLVIVVLAGAGFAWGSWGVRRPS